MHFQTSLLNSFVISLVLCTCYCESGSYEGYENTVLGFTSQNVEDVLLKKDDYFNLHNDSKWSAYEKECECKNGRCENVCAEWKNGACYKMKKECVCYPEFGKLNSKTCIYCDCGKGFNCTAERMLFGNKRTCICPEGYYDIDGKCEPFCSKNRPCLNGGLCRGHACDCRMVTHGAFCQHIDFCGTQCKPRLLVDCLYIEKTDTFGCLCKNRSLVFDYDELICKPCPCGEGTCIDTYRELRCNCTPGYIEFQKQCKKCDCGPDHKCELLKNGEKHCKCREGFFAREGTCLPCNCAHYKASCELDSSGRKLCICPEGYENILGLCEEKKPEKANCTCDLSTALCEETVDGYNCVCKEGYMRKVEREAYPDEPCTDIDECYDGKRCLQSANQKCVNFPGSYMCQCETGYQPASETADIHNITCKKYKPSWLPTGITIAVVLIFIGSGIGFVVFLKKRKSSNQTSGMELRSTR